MKWGGSGGGTRWSCRHRTTTHKIFRNIEQKAHKMLENFEKQHTMMKNIEK